MHVALPVTIHTAFTASHSALDVLHSQLQHHAQENAAIQAFLSAQATLLRGSASDTLTTLPYPDPFNREDGGASLKRAVDSLAALTRTQAALYLSTANSLHKLVVALSDYCDSYAARLENGKQAVTEYVAAFEGECVKVGKARAAYESKCVKLEEEEDEARFHSSSASTSHAKPVISVDTTTAATTTNAKGKSPKALMSGVLEEDEDEDAGDKSLEKLELEDGHSSPVSSKTQGAAKLSRKPTVMCVGPSRTLYKIY